MNRRFLSPHFLRSHRGYSCLAETYQTTGARGASSELPKALMVSSLWKCCIAWHWLIKSHMDPVFSSPSKDIMLSLFQGYRPVFKPHHLGWEVESRLLLSPSQQMCYYDGKLFGGYVAFLMDRILADCCKPAFTAYLNTSFLLPIPPTAPILLRAWPDKVEGRKIFLKGSVQIAGNNSNEWLDAIHAEALFIRPKNWAWRNGTP